MGWGTGGVKGREDARAHPGWTLKPPSRGRLGGGVGREIGGALGSAAHPDGCAPALERTVAQLTVAVVAPAVRRRPRRCPTDVGVPDGEVLEGVAAEPRDGREPVLRAAVAQL